MINFFCIDVMKNCIKNNLNNVNYYNVCMNVIKCYIFYKKKIF